MKELFPNVFLNKKQISTPNLVPGKKVYGEKTFVYQNKEFRNWDARQSKLAAAIVKGLKHLNLKPTSVVLYLGASSGTTASHVSDIVNNGFVFAVDNAPRVVRELVFLAEERPNIAPLLADAAQPETYAYRISKVDWIYQDIAAKNQVDTFLKNVQLFLEKNGTAILCLKAKSIDITKKTAEVCTAAEQELRKHLSIVQKLTLEPYYKDHCVFVCRR